MGIGGIVKSVVDKGREIINGAENTVKNTVKTAEKIVPTASQLTAATQTMTSKFLGNDVVSDITRAAVNTTQKLSSPVTNAATGGILDDITDFGKGLLDRGKNFVNGAKDFVTGQVERTIDAGRSIFNGTVEGITGLVRSVGEGVGQVFTGVGQLLNPSPLAKVFQGDFSGAWNDFKSNVSNGFQNIGGGIVKSTVQPVFDTAVVTLQSGVSAVQTFFGVEPPSRPLNEQEISQLRTVYGDSIDYSQIRLKEGHLGIQNGLAPHTVGNTIYIPQGWLDPNNPDYQKNRSELLTHETAHVWQYQNGGTDYIGESVWNQFKGWVSGGDRGAAYQFEQPIKDGKSWSELNPEQQAHLIEEAYNQNLFNDPNARFVYNGNDYTDYVRDAMNQMRAGRGAP